MNTCEGSTPLLLTTFTLRSARASWDVAAPRSAIARNERAVLISWDLVIGISELVLNFYYGSLLRFCDFPNGIRAVVSRYDIEPTICAKSRSLQGRSASCP